MRIKNGGAKPKLHAAVLGYINQESACPHSEQNLLPGFTGAPQPGHTVCSFAPQALQNLAFAKICAPHCGQTAPAGAVGAAFTDTPAVRKLVGSPIVQRYTTSKISLGSFFCLYAPMPAVTASGHSRKSPTAPAPSLSAHWPSPSVTLSYVPFTVSSTVVASFMPESVRSVSACAA